MRELYATAVSGRVDRNASTTHGAATASRAPLTVHCRLAESSLRVRASSRTNCASPQHGAQIAAADLPSDTERDDDTVGHGSALTCLNLSSAKANEPLARYSSAKTSNSGRSGSGPRWARELSASGRDSPARTPN